MATHYRQGDILIEKLTKKNTPSLKRYKVVRPKDGKLILAEGEATGHHHEFEESEHITIRELREDEIDGRVIEVTNTVELTHPEHGPITLEPGTYMVTRQQEYEESTPDRTTKSGARWVYD